MDKFEVVLLSKALKFYEKAPDDLVKRLDRCFEVLEHNPLWGPNIKILRTDKSHKVYRYRVGGYRVLYEIDQQEKRVGIHLILTRSHAYRNY